MARRRKYQEGNLFVRGKRKKVWVGRWYEDVLLPNGSRGRIRRSEVLGPVSEIRTERQARNLLDQRLRPVNNCAQRPQAVLLFERFVEDHWLPVLFPTFKFSTRKGYEYLLGKHLLPYFGKERLCDINRANVQTFVASLGRRLAPKSVQLARNLLSKVLATAVEWGFLTDNPVRLVRLPPRSVQPAKRYLTREQVQRLLQALREPAGTLVLLAVLTGMRRCELFALRWGSVDFSRRIISVRESVYEGHFSTPKTRSSVRDIPMSPAVVQALRARAIDASDGALIFASRKGTPLNPRNLMRRVIWPACDRVGLSRIGWHVLRHTCSTLLSDRGEALPTVQALLGHSHVQTTLGYTHPVFGTERAAVEGLERALVDPNGPKSEVGSSLIH